VFDEMALPEELLHAVSVGLDAFESVLNDLLAVFIVHNLGVAIVLCITIVLFGL